MSTNPSTLQPSQSIVDIDAARHAMEVLNFTTLNGKPIRIMFSHRDPVNIKSGHASLKELFSEFGSITSCKKLHILADIGMLLVKVLTNSSMPSYLPGSMLLPSSFYKVSSDIRCEEENLNSVAHCSFDENSIEKSYTSTNPISLGLLATSLAKQCRISQEESLPLNGSKNTGNDFPLHKEAGKLVTRIKLEKENTSLTHCRDWNPEKTVRQVSTRGKNKQASSPSDDGLVEIIKQEGVNGSTKLNLGRNQNSSSCGSIITKQTSESLVLVKEVDIVQCGTLREKSRKTRKLASEPLEFSESSLENKCSSKGVGGMDETLIGHRIKLWSPIDKCDPEVSSSISNPQEIDVPSNRTSMRTTVASKRKSHSDIKRAPYAGCASMGFKSCIFLWAFMWFSFSITSVIGDKCVIKCCPSTSLDPDGEETLCTRVCSTPTPSPSPLPAQLRSWHSSLLASLPNRKMTRGRSM